jgi:hypothetical protein
MYAIVANLELARIGFNDITQQYAVDSEQRAARHKALLESVLYTLCSPTARCAARKIRTSWISKERLYSFHMIVISLTS